MSLAASGASALLEPPLAAHPPSVPPADSRHAADPQNPWPGLDAFDETTAQFFNGREEESAELARLVLQAPLTVVFGKSGLGKTSLLKAGLFPLLREAGVLPVYVRLVMQDDTTPLIEQLDQALAREVALHGIDMQPADFGGGLWERLHQRGFSLWSARNELLTPLFVVDQFEEVFTLGAVKAKAIKGLRMDLADLVENRIPPPLVRAQEADTLDNAAFDCTRQRYKVLVSLREDFLPDLEGWRRELPSLMRNRFRLRAMNAQQAFAAVYETGRPGALVDRNTAKAIVRFVGNIQADDPKPTATSESAAGDREADDDLSRHEIEPALLSLVCAELNKLRQNGRPPQPSINADLLKGTGASIIADFYLRQVAKVPSGTRRFIEEELLTEGGYRTSFPIAEALKDGALTQETLDRLVNGRLLRIDQQLGTARVELTHDRLTEVVRAERDKRRHRERTARVRWLVIGAAIVLTPLIFWGMSNWIARYKSEEALEKMENALAEAKAERIESDRQRLIAEKALQAAEDARKKTEAERARADEQRRIAEQSEQRAVAEQAKARAANLRVQEQAEIASLLRIEIQGRGMSSGFLVSRSGLVVTAGHLVEAYEKRPIRALNPNGTISIAEIVRLDRERDLALLKIGAGSNTPCLQLAIEPPKVGAAVVALAMSPTAGWRAMAGTVTSVNASLGNVLGRKEAGASVGRDLIEIEIDAEGGFSGAPVMDASSRRVIGMGAYARGGEGVRRHYLIPASRIRATFGSELGGEACGRN
jgi:hypothetical protein